MTKGRKSSKAEAEERRSHNVSLRWRQAAKFEDMFWKLMVLRQIETISKRIKQPISVAWSGTLWLGLTLESWIANYDWEEPVVQNSEWHHRRTGIISDLFSDDFAKFCVCLVTFYFGSDEWLAALRSHKTKLRDVNDPSCDSKNLAWFYEAAIRGYKGNPFHKRYNPQRIRADEWERVARLAGADLATFETLEMVWDDFSEEEAM